MQIDKFTQEKYQFKAMLNNIQRYADNSLRNKIQINPEKLSRDLYVANSKCNSNQLRKMLNHTFVQLAEKMERAKQDSLAGIIYSFLIKVNSDNTTFLKFIGPKALEIAKKQKDSVHIASRAGDLANAYKDKDENLYLQYLRIKKDALTDVCTNYGQFTKRFKTISRPLNTKKAYVLTLIRTEIDMAKQKENTNPEEARKELVSIYKKINNQNGIYFVDDMQELGKINLFLKTRLSKDIFNTNNEDNLKKSFRLTARKILNSVKNREPLNVKILGDYFSDMYDKFKNNSLEAEFINSSISLIDNLNGLDTHVFISKLYTILFDKNKNNPNNTRIIAKHGFNQRVKEKDEFGIVFFGQKYARALKGCNKFSPTENMDILSKTMNASKNIIQNYDELSHKTKLRPKNDYIRQLAFNKVDAAKLIAKKYPDLSKQFLQEASALIKALPKDYVKQNPAIEKLREYISNLVK